MATSAFGKERGIVRSWPPFIRLFFVVVVYSFAHFRPQISSAETSVLRKQERETVAVWCPFRKVECSPRAGPFCFERHSDSSVTCKHRVFWFQRFNTLTTKWDVSSTKRRNTLRGSEGSNRAATRMHRTFSSSGFPSAMERLGSDGTRSSKRGESSFPIHDRFDNHHSFFLLLLMLISYIHYPRRRR